MRRKPGKLIPIEWTIIEAAIQLRKEGSEDFFGFQIAKKIRNLKGTRFLTATEHYTALSGGWNSEESYGATGKNYPPTARAARAADITGLPAQHLRYPRT